MPIRLAEVTLDPLHDRSKTLRRYADAVGARSPRWAFVTGRPADILGFAQRFGITQSPSRIGLVHTEIVAVVSSQGVVET